MHSLELAENEGFESISVRKLANLIGSSTAPIYTAFKNVEELIKETKTIAINKVLEYTSQKYTDEFFLNIGVGLLVFAREHSNLFRELFITNPENEFKELLHKEYLTQMKNSKLSSIYTEKELEVLLTKMWIFTYGLGALICSSQVKDLSTDFFIGAQQEIGSEIMLARLYKKGILDQIENKANIRGEVIEDSDIEWNIH